MSAIMAASLNVKVTTNFRARPPRKQSYTRCFQGNLYKVCIHKNLEFDKIMFSFGDCFP